MHYIRMPGMAGKPVLLKVFNDLLYPVIEELTEDP
jgi:hypothetical protein